MDHMKNTKTRGCHSHFLTAIAFPSHVATRDGNHSYRGRLSGDSDGTNWKSTIINPNPAGHALLSVTVTLCHVTVAACFSAIAFPSPVATRDDSVNFFFQVLELLLKLVLFFLHRFIFFFHRFIFFFPNTLWVSECNSRRYYEYLEVIAQKHPEIASKQ